MARHSKAPKPAWLAWGITVGEGLLLAAYGVVLSQYWLMLPVRLRVIAGGIFAVGAIIIVFRLWRFYRAHKAAEQKTPEREINVEPEKPTS